MLSTVAEAGYVLIGLGLGGAAGDTGAYMHLGYQAAMRGLVLMAGWYLIHRTRSAKLKDLAGSGERMPIAATLFGFGVFSVMGLSPFKGSFSKFCILTRPSSRDSGLWPSRHARDHRCGSLLHDRHSAGLPRAPGAGKWRWRTRRHGSPCACPCADGAYRLMSLWPAPFLGLPRRLPGLPVRRAVPQFESPWASLAVLVPYLKRFRLYLPRPAIGRACAMWRRAARDCDGSRWLLDPASIRPRGCSRCCWLRACRRDHLFDRLHGRAASPTATVSSLPDDRFADRARDRA